MSFYEELLQSDWLGRNPEDYTYAKSGLSIGWEDTLTKGDALSKFMLKVDGKNLKVDRKVLLAKQACTNILSRMNVNKKKAKIVFTDKFSSYQMGSTVCVTLEPLSGKIKFPSYNHSLDPILGFAVHEIAHFLYTDERYPEYLKKFKGNEAKLKQMIMNVLEDERIEQIVAGTFRGYTGYLGKAKDYCFGKRLKEEMDKRQVDEQQDIVQLANTFLHLLRYPKALEPAMVNKFENELKQITDILTPYPSDIPELITATEKIYDIFQQSADGDGQGDGDDSDEDGQPNQNQKSNSKSKSGKGSGSKSDQDNDQEDNSDNDQDDGDDENGDEDKDKNKGKGKGKKDQEDGDDEEEDGDGDGSDGDDDQEDKKDKNSGGEGDDEDDQDNDQDGDGSGNNGKQDIDKMLEAFAEALLSSAPQTGGSADDVAKLIGAKGEYMASEIIEEISNYNNEDIAPYQSFSHFFPSTENLQTSEMKVVFNDAKNLRSSTNNYDKGLSEVRSYASSLRAKIQQLNRSQDVTYKGLTEGDFDDGMLIDAIIGAKNIYKQDHRIMNRGACVGLLIDESGSMDRAGRWYNAMKIAIMFERALEGVNGVDFYCYGHTTGKDLQHSYSDATWINVYYEGRKVSDRKVLGKIYNHNTNRDGHAILEVIGRMRTKVPQNIPIILFMISDGEPSASVPNGYDGISYTRKAVTVVQKYSNTQVVHIAIDKGIPSKDMFDTYVEFTDPQRMVMDIGNLLKKIITKQQMPVTL